MFEAPMAPAVRGLILQIESAFPDAPPPPYDRGLDHLLPEDAAVFRRTRWRTIVSARLPHDAVYFLADEAYRYYLPALMVTALRWPRRAGNLRDSTLSSLLAPRPSDPERAAFSTRMDAFTLEQRQAILAFLVHLDVPGSIDPRASRARRRYWNAAGR
jgi:hypothetical protein